MCWRMWYLLSSLLVVLSVSCAHTVAHRLEHGNLRPAKDFCSQLEVVETPKFTETLGPYVETMDKDTAVVVLEDGGGALTMRAWLCDAAEERIDVQYFIFSADNVGLIALDFLLRAAERGVAVRLLVDDLLVDGDSDLLQIIDTHPNIAVKVYNPALNIGKNFTQKVKAVLTDFRGINQRMHNKAFIVDGKAVITGGRNMADEYYDYNRGFNFRDRDVLLVGAAVKDVQASFDKFWESKLSVGVDRLVYPDDALDAQTVWEQIHQYACDPNCFWPQVRAGIAAQPEHFTQLAQEGTLAWVEGVRFVSDLPGKNKSKKLRGGGITTDALLKLVGEAKKSIVIQTPYLVTTGLSRGPFKEAVKRGVTLKILTNSLASTDNLAAFNGYARDREQLLATGAELYEFRPDAAIRKSAMTSALVEEVARLPVFGIHAKTMVVDGEILVVGTFNVDPRSANLNTECVVIIPSRRLAQEVEKGILEEMEPENAWPTTLKENPDKKAGCGKRFKAWWYRLIPKNIL